MRSHPDRRIADLGLALRERVTSGLRVALVVGYAQATLARLDVAKAPRGADDALLRLQYLDLALIVLILDTKALELPFQIIISSMPAGGRHERVGRFEAEPAAANADEHGQQRQ